MATKTTKQRDRLQQQLALAQYDSREFDDDDEELTNSVGQRVGVARPEGSFTQDELNRMGAGNIMAAPEPEMSQGAGGYNALRGGLAGSLNSTSARSVPQTTLPNKVNLNTFNSSSPFLFGKVDSNTLARELLQTNKPQLPVSTGSPAVTGITKPKVASPEDKLLEAMARTNPTPRSIWKRLAVGAARGASQVTREDSIGSAVGKLLGGAGAQAVPFVDREFQYERNKRKALETYKVEAERREQQQKQQKLDADIAEANARLQESRNRREELRDERTRQAASRLADDRRAEATQLLNQLEGLPADDPMRDVIANKLRVEYKTPASKNYGLNKQTPGQGNITIYDEASGNYIRAKADGTPLLKDGKPVVVRPGAENAKKKETQAQALQRIEQDEIAREGTVEQIAIDMVDVDGIINAMPQDLRDAIRGGEASSLKAKQAREEYDKRYDSALKKARATVESTRKQNIARRLAEERGTKQSTSNTVPVTSNKQAPSSNKPRIQATQRNAVGNRDFRNPRVIKLR